MTPSTSRNNAGRPLMMRPVHDFWTVEFIGRTSTSPVAPYRCHPAEATREPRLPMNQSDVPGRETRPDESLRSIQASELAPHANRRLAALIVAGELAELAIPQPLVERLRAAVRRTHLQEHQGDASHESRLLEPCDETVADAPSAMLRSHA